MSSSGMVIQDDHERVPCGTMNLPQVLDSHAQPHLFSRLWHSLKEFMIAQFDCQIVKTIRNAAGGFDVSKLLETEGRPA